MRIEDATTRQHRLQTGSILWSWTAPDRITPSVVLSAKSHDVVSKLISTPPDYPRAYICDECIAVCNAIIEDDIRDRIEPEKPRPVTQYLDQEVVGPDSLPRSLALVVAEQSTHSPGKIVVLGPASGWKTRLAKTVAQLLQVPFAIVDGTPRP